MAQPMFQTAQGVQIESNTVNPADGLSCRSAITPAELSIVQLPAPNPIAGPDDSTPAACARAAQQSIMTGLHSPPFRRVATDQASKPLEHCWFSLGATRRRPDFLLKAVKSIPKKFGLGRGFRPRASLDPARMSCMRRYERGEMIRAASLDALRRGGTVAGKGRRSPRAVRG